MFSSATFFRRKLFAKQPSYFLLLRSKINKSCLISPGTCGNPGCTVRDSYLASALCDTSEGKEIDSGQLRECFGTSLFRDGCRRGKYQCWRCRADDGNRDITTGGTFGICTYELPVIRDALQSEWIDGDSRVVESVGVEIYSVARESDRVTRDVSAESRIVVPVPVVVEPRLPIEVLSGKQFA